MAGQTNNRPRSILLHTGTQHGCYVSLRPCSLYSSVLELPVTQMVHLQSFYTQCSLVCYICTSIGTGEGTDRVQQQPQNEGGITTDHEGCVYDNEGLVAAQSNVAYGATAGQTMCHTFFVRCHNNE